MTRKSNGKTTARSAAQVRSLRSQIDRLDHQIQKLLNVRAKTAGNLGNIKAENAAEIFVPAREEEILQNLVATNKGPLDPQTVRSIFRELISGSRALQKVLKVAYLGPEYGNSHQAMVERFGAAVEGIAVGSVAAVFEEVNRAHADFGIVPLENSTEGRLSDTLELFIRLPQLKIVAEVRVRVHHHLLSNAQQQEVRRIYSRSQILSQTRNWLSKNIPHAQAVEVTSTSVAAELASREPGSGAIASRHAANKYGLKVLFSDIEDNPIGESRFAVIGAETPERTGKDRTAIMFQAAHRPGSLVEALNIFKINKINLHAIESFPAKGSRAESMFFLDFDGHVQDMRVKRAIETLNRKSERVIFLGSFPVSEAVE